jgi:hypothetical protein
MFLGTARTSIGKQRTCVSKRAPCYDGRHTPFRHLHQEELLALLRFSDVRRNERVLPCV